MLALISQALYPFVHRARIALDEKKTVAGDLSRLLR